MLSPEFQVEWRDEESSRFVQVSGEVDLATVEKLRQALNCSRSRLELDLINVAFMDLAGLNCLLEAAQRHDVVALRPSSRVSRLLDLTATWPLFERR